MAKSSPESATASIAEAMANCANRSIRRSSWGLQMFSRSASHGTSPPNWTRKPDTSKSVIGPTPLSPRTSRSQNPPISLPRDVTTPSPVTTARRFMPRPVMLCPPGLSKSPESRFTGPPGGEWVFHGTATGQGGVAARPACDGECLLACRLRLLLLGLLVLLVVFLGVVAFAHDSFPRVVWGSRYKTGAESSHGRAIWATGFSGPGVRKLTHKSYGTRVPEIRVPSWLVPE